jgi:hypothetical protein
MVESPVTGGASFSRFLICGRFRGRGAGPAVFPGDTRSSSGDEAMMPSASMRLTTRATSENPKDSLAFLPLHL